MQDLVEVFKSTTNSLTNPELIKYISQYRASTKKVLSQCIINDLTTPALSEAVQFFNGMTTKYSSANVIQAQRDYFGAHSYQKIDDDSEKKYHTNWK